MSLNCIIRRYIFSLRHVIQTIIRPNDRGPTDENAYVYDCNRNEYWT